MFQPMFYDLIRFKTLIYSFQFVMVKSVGLSQLLPQNMQSVRLILQPGPHLHSRKPPNYTIKWQTARKFLTIGKRISPLLFVTTLCPMSPSEADIPGLAVTCYKPCPQPGHWATAYLSPAFRTLSTDHHNTQSIRRSQTFFCKKHKLSKFNTDEQRQSMLTDKKIK